MAESMHQAFSKMHAKEMPMIKEGFLRFEFRKDDEYPLL